MKIKLERIESDWSDEVLEWIESDDEVEVEVPDAIVTEWRAIRERLGELEQYFEERVKPQIDAEYARRREEWRCAHPEQAKRDDALVRMWSQTLFNQVAGYGRKKPE